MKKLFFILLLLIFIVSVPASAKTQFKSMEELINYLNASGELLHYLDYATGSKIDINKCKFIEESRLYTCPVNYSTTLHVYTDKYLRPEMVVIEGPLDDQGSIKRTTFDWAMAALFAVIYPSDKYYDELTDIFISSIEKEFYQDEYNYLICEWDYDTWKWHYIISNK